MEKGKESLKVLQDKVKEYRNMGPVEEKKPTKTSKELNAKYQNLKHRKFGEEDGEEDDEKNLSEEFINATKKLEKYKGEIGKQISNCFLIL